MSIISIVQSQNCIDYGEFDDSPCDACAPGDWNNILSSEIDDAATFGWCSNLSESPTGGTMVGLDVFAGSSEGIEVTIDDLVPGTTYSIGFWWICCEWLDPGNFIVEIDGETTVFGTNSEWELVSLCFTPSSSSIDITLTGESLGNQSHIFIDDAFCEEVENCCPLTIEVPEEYDVCPNEDIIIETEVDMEEGSVSYEWTSDPEDGIDYLDDPNSANPVFHLPITGDQFDGETYTFTVQAEDNNCVVSDMVIVNVYSYPEITFDFTDQLFCQNDGTFDYPLVSNEGISGTWQTQSIDLMNYANTTFENIFTPNASDVDCPIEYNFEIEIDAYQIPEFEFALELCNADDQFTFPETSINNIDGEWSIEAIDFDNFAPGDYSNTFTAYDDFCVATLDIEIEILEAEPVEFSLPDSICVQESIFLLPTNSDNNIEGYWEPNQIDPSSIIDSITCHFTHQESDCISNYSHTFYATENLEVFFDIPDTLCKDEVLFLPDTTLQGINGNWATNTIRLDTVQSDSIILYWSPLNTNQCINDFTRVLYIQNYMTPLFSIPSVYCMNDPVFIFPSISDNGILGTWDIDSYDPSSGVGLSLTNNFTPLINECALPTSVTVISTDQITPQFNLTDTLCASNETFTFPTLSDNGIEGSWETTSFTPDNYSGQIFTNTFTTSDNSSNCVEPAVTIDIFIKPKDAPTFNLPSLLCIHEGNITLPTFSTNGINGNWSIPTINATINTDNKISVEFIPLEQDCYLNIQHDFEVIGGYQSQVMTFDATDCNSNDGMIIIPEPNSPHQFSLDDSNIWQFENTFNNLNPGTHYILIRYLDLPDCLDTINFEIRSPMLPEVGSTETTQNSSCQQPNGTALINMIGNDFEFSIDDGITWQTDNTFENLAEGIYAVMIRSSNSPECINEVDIDIEGFDAIAINNTAESQPTGCTTNDGIIEVNASGENLIFSIDDGLTWSNSNIFSNLTAGSYTILVNSETYIDCLDSIGVILTSPAQPIINNISTTHPNSCDETSGEITITNQGLNAEYSIDNGVTWQDSPIFLNLNPDVYGVVIRDKYMIDCASDTIEVTLSTEEIYLIDESDILVNQPSNCQSDNGVIEILNTSADIAYSLDGGLTWVSSHIFDNLIPGIYNIMARHILYTDCIKTISNITLNPFSCPCEEIEYSTLIFDILCTDINNGQSDIINIIGYTDQVNSIEWADGQTGSTARNLSEGWHSFIIHYDDDCSVEDSIFIKKYDPLDFVLESFDNSCNEQTNGSIEITNVSGGSGHYLYALNNSIFQEESTFYNLSAGEFEAMVIDSMGCLKSEFTTIQQGQVVDINLPEIMSITNGESVYLNPLINEATIDSFEWSPQTNILNTNELVASVQPNESTAYTLTIYYGDCIETRTIFIDVKFETDIYIGSVFTPNFDGDNDIIFIQSNHNDLIDINSFKIFDRWGNLVFTKQTPTINNSDDGWDGRYNGDMAIPGVYVYTIEYNNNGVIDYKVGSITLLR